MSIRNAFVTTAFALFAAGVAPDAGAQQRSQGPCAADVKKFCGDVSDREMHEGARGRAFLRVPGKFESARRESREDARGMQGRRGEILQGHRTRGRAYPVLPQEPAAGAPARVRGGIQARGGPQAARSIAATGQALRGSLA